MANPLNVTVKKLEHHTSGTLDFSNLENSLALVASDLDGTKLPCGQYVIACESTERTAESQNGVVDSTLWFESPVCFCHSLLCRGALPNPHPPRNSIRASLNGSTVSGLLPCPTTKGNLHALLRATGRGLSLALMTNRTIIG